MANNSVPMELARLRHALEQVKKGQRIAHGASVENAAVTVNDSTGSLRTILGVQGDGTVGVNVVNGGPPPTPSTPTVAPAVGGIAVGWDGTSADGSVLPLDWSRVEVHASATAVFDPVPDTLMATMETPQGAICYLPVSGPTYVRILARNTSGAASAATPVVGPYSPRPIAGEIGIGEITATMISDGAVTTPKLFANAVTTAKLSAGSVDATALKADAITGKIITGGEVNGTTVTGGLIRTAASGERIALNESNLNRIALYNASNVGIGELSARGLGLQGTSGAQIWLDPEDTYPNLRFTNAAQTSEAVINVSDGTAGTAALGLNSGLFTGSGFTDMKWRTWFGNDFWIAERFRSSNASTVIGGRIFMSDSTANISFRNSADPTQDSYLLMQAGIAHINLGRLRVTPNSSANPAVFANIISTHTGPLLSLQKSNTDRFTVSEAGNVVAAGTIQAANFPDGAWQDWTPVWTTSSGSATPSFGNATIVAKYTKIARTVLFRLEITFGSTTNFGSSPSASDNWRFSAPVTAAGTSSHCGFGEVQDASAAGSGIASRVGTRVRLTSTTTLELETSTGRVDGAALTTPNWGVMDALTPWTWANGDSIRINGFYESAA